MCNVTVFSHRYFLRGRVHSAEMGLRYIYMAAPLKKTHFENSNFHARKGSNIMYEPKFQDHNNSNSGDYPWQPQIDRFLTLKCKLATIKNAHFENLFFRDRKDSNITLRLPRTTENGLICNTKVNGQPPPFKMQMLK